MQLLLKRKEKGMKAIKKTLSICLALILMLGVGATALFAAPGAEVDAAAQKGTLTVNGTTAGKTYAVYKVFDLTQSGDNYSYTVNENFKDYFTKKNIADPIAYVKDLSGADLSNLAKDMFSWARANNIAPAAKQKAGGTSMTINGLDYGYYIMNPLGASGPDGQTATMFSMSTVSGKDTTINVKAVYPTIDKNIKEGDNTSKTGEASIGDDITYVLESKVPDMTGYSRYYFIINDTLSKGLTYKQIDSVKVGQTTLTKDDDYTVETSDAGNGKTAVKIVFKNFLEKYKAEAGAAVVVEYKAKLNADAVAGVAEVNKASLTYSNDPTFNYTGDRPEDEKDPEKTPPTGETAKVETETYTTSLTINKKDGDGKTLAGAAFRITGNGVNIVVTTGDVYTKATDGTFWKLTDGTYTATDPNGDGVDQTKYESKTDKYKKEAKAVIDTKGSNVDAEAFVNAEGTLTFTGLGAGTYTISEIVTPNGYNSIRDITVDVSFDKTKKAFAATASDGNTVSVENNKLSMTVVNKSGSLLPSTGGIGTTIFYIVGAALLLGGGLMLFRRKFSRSNG